MLKMINNMAVTFFIGLVAGTTPFVFMQLLPQLLSPGLDIQHPNYWAVILVGLLVGSITTIIFAKRFDSMEPKDVFFYALGIPAILLATVSNITNNFSTTQQLNIVKDRASMDIIKTENIEYLDIPEIEEMKETPRSIKQEYSGEKKSKELGFNLPFIGMVYAQGNTNSSSDTIPRSLENADSSTQPKKTKYYLSIGQYNNKEEALKYLNKYKKQKIKTNKYIESDLDVLQIDTNSYIIQYSNHSTKSEAIKAYKLLKINDPQYSVKLFKF